VPRTSCKVSEIFKLLEEYKEELGIADWGISDVGRCLYESCDLRVINGAFSL
jgi:hypothetical protein